MTTVLVRARVRRRRRADGVDELVRRSVADLAAAELLMLASLCTGSALLAGALGKWPALCSAAAVLAAYLIVRARRLPGRTLAIRALPRAADAGRGPAPQRAPVRAGPVEVARMIPIDG